MNIDKVYEEIRRNDPQYTPLGYTFSPEKMDYWIKTVFGAVAFPGKNPGFIAVAGMSKRPEIAGKHVIYLLDEYESYDMRRLIRQVGVLNQKYKPYRWVGDSRNTAVDRFRREMNEENSTKVSFHSSTLFDIEFPYEYILPTIRYMINQDSRLLHLKESLSLGYMASIKPDEIRDMPWGEYPAIEAVGMVAIELRDHGNAEEQDRAMKRKIRECQEMYCMRWS